MPPTVELSAIVETVTFALLGGILPALIWLWFWLKEDAVHPEPKKLLFRVFFWGALSVFAAYVVERGIFRFFFADLGIATSSLVVLSSWAITEEVIKFGAAYFAVFHNRDFDEPIDAMIYLITAALGFAALENSFFLFDALSASGQSGIFLLTGNLRFLGATLLHVITSAALGGIIALTFCSKSPTQKKLFTLGGLTLAVVLHIVFNWFIINSGGQEILRIFTLLWLSTIFIIFWFEKVKTIVCKPK